MCIPIICSVRAIPQSNHCRCSWYFATFSDRTFLFQLFRPRTDRPLHKETGCICSRYRNHQLQQPLYFFHAVCFCASISFSTSDFPFFTALYCQDRNFHGNTRRNRCYRLPVFQISRSFKCRSETPASQLLSADPRHRIRLGITPCCKSAKFLNPTGTLFCLRHTIKL